MTPRGSRRKLQLWRSWWDLGRIGVRRGRSQRENNKFDIPRKMGTSPTSVNMFTNYNFQIVNRFRGWCELCRKFLTCIWTVICYHLYRGFKKTPVKIINVHLARIKAVSSSWGNFHKFGAGWTERDGQLVGQNGGKRWVSRQSKPNRQVPRSLFDSRPFRAH